MKKKISLLNPEPFLKNLISMSAGVARHSVHALRASAICQQLKHNIMLKTPTQLADVPFSSKRASKRESNASGVNKKEQHLFRWVSTAKYR